MVGKLETRSVGALRTRWAAIGAAVAVTFGAGGMIAVNAAPEPPYSSDAGAFVVLEQPVRLLDTRVSSQPYVYCDNGGGSEPMGPVTDGDTCILDFAANGQVPWNPSLEDDECADTDVCTTAVVLNLTAVNPESKGFATITQGCNGLIGNTDTSNLNWTCRQPPAELHQSRTTRTPPLQTRPLRLCATLTIKAPTAPRKLP